MYILLNIQFCLSLWSALILHNDERLIQHVTASKPIIRNGSIFYTLSNLNKSSPDFFVSKNAYCTRVYYMHPVIHCLFVRLITKYVKCLMVVWVHRTDKLSWIHFRQNITYDIDDADIFIDSSTSSNLKSHKGCLITEELNIVVLNCSYGHLYLKFTNRHNIKQYWKCK